MPMKTLPARTASFHLGAETSGLPANTSSARQSHPAPPVFGQIPTAELNQSYPASPTPPAGYSSASSFDSLAEQSPPNHLHASTKGALPEAEVAEDNNPTFYQTRDLLGVATPEQPSKRRIFSHGSSTPKRPKLPQTQPQSQTQVLGGPQDSDVDDMVNMIRGKLNRVQLDFPIVDTEHIQQCEDLLHTTPSTDEKELLGQIESSGGIPPTNFLRLARLVQAAYAGTNPRSERSLMDALAVALHYADESTIAKCDALLAENTIRGNIEDGRTTTSELPTVKRTECATKQT